MGGSSGAMFSIFWEASAVKLEVAKEVSADSITEALEAGNFNLVLIPGSGGLMVQRVLLLLPLVP